MRLHVIQSTILVKNSNFAQKILRTKDDFELENDEKQRSNDTIEVQIDVE